MQINEFPAFSYFCSDSLNNFFSCKILRFFGRFPYNVYPLHLRTALYGIPFNRKILNKAIAKRVTLMRPVFIWVILKNH